MPGTLLSFLFFFVLLTGNAQANAKIEGDTARVWNHAVKNPKDVRYVWADSPVNANLYNKEVRADGTAGPHLPASPFSTEE